MRTFIYGAGKKLKSVSLLMIAATAAVSSPSVAAAAERSFIQLYIDARGGCVRTFSLSGAISAAGVGKPFGRPFAQWTDADLQAFDAFAVRCKQQFALTNAPVYVENLAADIAKVRRTIVDGMEQARILGDPATDQLAAQKEIEEASRRERRAAEDKAARDRLAEEQRQARLAAEDREAAEARAKLAQSAEAEARNRASAEKARATAAIAEARSQAGTAEAEAQAAQAEAAARTAQVNAQRDLETSRQRLALAKGQLQGIQGSREAGVSQSGLGATSDPSCAASPEAPACAKLALKRYEYDLLQQFAIARSFEDKVVEILAGTANPILVDGQYLKVQDPDKSRPLPGGYSAAIRDAGVEYEETQALAECRQAVLSMRFLLGTLAGTPGEPNEHLISYRESAEQCEAYFRLGHKRSLLRN